jgi:hypothetical protein
MEVGEPFGSTRTLAEAERYGQTRRPHLRLMITPGPSRLTVDNVCR